MSQNQSSSGNGCGPESWPLWIKELLFNWFFEASCDKHDKGYGKGGGEVWRFECDWKFRLAMRRDTLRRRGLTRIACWIVATCFYVIVRWRGHKSFNYTDGREPGDP